VLATTLEFVTSSNVHRHHADSAPAGEPGTVGILVSTVMNVQDTRWWLVKIAATAPGR
jgi:hypothetical protein